MSKSKQGLRALFFILLWAMMSGCGKMAVPQIHGNIPPGTMVDNVDLSGLEPKAGQAKIQNWAKGKLAENVLLVYNKAEVPLSLQELGVHLDLEKTWQELSRHPGGQTASYWKVDRQQAAEVLDEKLSRFNRPARDAGYKIVNDKFVVQPGTPGHAVDVDALIQEFDGHTWSEIPKRLTIPVVDVPPAVSTEAVQSLGFDSVVGEFSTRYAVEDKNRSDNLQSAAKALDKKTVLPGQTFSFNNTVGPRTPETGYKDAYVIVNNEYVEGIGGGVCQVSSTLYNAALMANLKIVARMPHAVAISYVPLGQDATVNYGDIDFKFQNNTDALIYIRTENKPGVLTIRMYGKKTGQTVTLKHEVVKETDFQVERRPDPSLPSGVTVQEQAGTKGYTVKSWRVVRDAQGKETEEYLGQDVYAPANRIIRYGFKQIR